MRLLKGENMKDKSLIVGAFVAVAMAICVNAYAAETCAFSDFFAGVGGFMYNTLPWNWGNWMGK